MRYISPTKKDPLNNIKYGSLASEEIYTFLRDSMQMPFVLEMAGITYPDKNYFIERKHNDYYILEYIVSGKGYIINKGNTFILEAGNVYILKPGEKHRYWSDKKQPYTKIWLNFFSDIFGQLLKSYGISDKTVFSCPESHIYFDELLKLSATSRFNNELCLEAGVIIFKIITEIAQTFSKKQIKSDLAKEMKIRLDSAIYDLISIEQIAKDFAVSKTHLINEFKKYYNETPYSYFLDKKIQTAKKLLIFTSLRINEIAFNLKFNDSHHFSNIFKQKTGMSPLEYKLAKK
jgi:AraC-like DNA-binding protein/quercetin dioxygenase-like cupin family protein